jgi:hypothetical protein
MVPVPVGLLVLYLACCGFVGLAGRKRRIGFLWSTLLSMLLTPLFVVLAFYAFGKRSIVPPPKH